MFWTYILKCADGSYYTGHTDELDKRVSEHQSGAIPGHTSKRRPVQLAYCAGFQTREEALNAELQIKRWSRKKKQALIAEDWASLRAAARKDFSKR